MDRRLARREDFLHQTAPWVAVQVTEKVPPYEVLVLRRNSYDVEADASAAFPLRNAEPNFLRVKRNCSTPVLETSARQLSQFQLRSSGKNHRRSFADFRAASVVVGKATKPEQSTSRPSRSVERRWLECTSRFLYTLSNVHKIKGACRMGGRSGGTPSLLTRRLLRG